MYLVSIILLLYYIGTKKKIVSFPPPLPQLFQPPLLLVSGEISNSPPTPPRIIPSPPIIRYLRVINIAPSTEFFCNCPVADF